VHAVAPSRQLSCARSKLPLRICESCHRARDHYFESHRGWSPALDLLALAPVSDYDTVLYEGRRDSHSILDFRTNPTVKRKKADDIGLGFFAINFWMARGDFLSLEVKNFNRLRFEI
jgi:hypothetical protein